MAVHPGVDMSPRAELARLRASFPYFLRRSWVATGRDRKFPLSWVDYDIAYYLGDKSIREKVLMCHRFRGKSTILEAYCAWNFLRNGDITIKVISKEDEAAAQYIRGLRRSWFMACPWLRHLIPPTTNDQSRKKADGAFRMDVATRDMATGARESSIASKGVTGHKTGGRAHILIPDDIETPENTKTQKARDELYEAFGEFSNIATYAETPEYPAGEILVAGTPHHEQSVYYKLANLGYDIRVIPLIVPDDPESYPHLSPAILRRVRNGRLKPGDLVSPRSHGPEFVARQRATQTRRTFLMQQMLQAQVPPEQKRLQVRDLIYDPDLDTRRGPVRITWGTTRGGETTQAVDVACYGYDGDAVHEYRERSDETAPYEGARMWIDPSGEGEDRTAHAVVATLNGAFFLTDAGEHLGSGYADEVKARLVSTARDCGVDLIVVEDNFGGGMFAEMLKPLVDTMSLNPGQDPRFPHGWTARVETARITRMSGDKLKRTYRTLAPLVDGHRLVVGPRVMRQEAFQHQLTRLDPDRQTLEHDDLIETVAAACGLWVSEAAVDPALAGRLHAERLAHEQLLREVAVSEAMPQPEYMRWIEHRR